MSGQSPSHQRERPTVTNDRNQDQGRPNVLVLVPCQRFVHSQPGSRTAHRGSKSVQVSVGSGTITLVRAKRPPQDPTSSPGNSKPSNDTKEGQAMVTSFQKKN